VQSIRAKDMALHEAEVKASSMAAMADRASLLDVELAVAQDTILSLEHTLHEARSVTQDVQLKLEKMGEIPQELGLAAKIEWLAATLTAEQSKAEDEANNVVILLTELGTSKQESETLAEQVAELNSKCVELEELVAKESSEKTALASELAIAQDTILSLENALHKARSVTQDVQLKLETMGDIPPELGLVAKIEWLAATLTAEQSKAEDLLNNAVTLLTELGTSKQESVTLTKQVAELNGKCVKLEELVAEESSEKTALASEIDVLQRVISDRDLAMEAEVAAHLKLQLDISMAMKLLDSVFQDQMFDAEESHPRFSLGLVESAIARIVEKYRSEACKVEELTHQIAVMAQEAETAKKERDLSMDQRVQQMRKMLDYTELELSKTVEKVREAAITMTQQDKENQVLVQQAQKMQSELLKTSDENVALQADIVMTKKRLSDVRDRLLLGLVGMDADGGDVSQGESPAQPLSEKAGEIQALADLFCLEMQKKDAALQESNERSLGMAATVSSLQLELDSLRRVSEECKQILLGFTDDATSEKAVRWPNEVSLSSITFPAVGMKWLINALNEEQQKASQAMHEVGRLEKAVDSVTLEIKDQKGRLEELSNELTFYKEENHGLAERLQVLSSEHTTLGEQAAQVSAERDAMKVEMLALENSLQANQEREHLEGYHLARSLEEMLKSAKLELSELSKKNTEMTAALVQHDDDIKGLLQECARLGGESSEARREADAFQAEMLKAVDEKDALQAELNQIEQKLSNTREKLGLAVKKGKAVEKQRDALKMSLEEKTQKLNSICISHKEELKVQDAKLHESREKFKSVAERVLELEFQLTSTLEKVTAAEQSLQDSQKFQEEVNIALSHISLLPSSLTTSKVIEKIEWLGMMLGKTQSMAVRSERELEVLSLKLREVQEKVQFLEMENSNGKEMILSWAKKVDEAEIRAASDRAHYESELEFQSQALWEAEARTHAAVAQVEEMQGALQQKQNSLKSMEASRGKAISKLTLTLNRLTELRQQSEGLVTEIENLHRELQNRDAEILGLKEKISNADAETQNWQERFSRVSAEANLEILKLRKELTEVNSRFEGNLEEMTILQNDLTQKTLELEKLQKHLEMMVLSKEDSSEQAEQSMVVTNQISRSAFEDVDTPSTNGTVDYVATIYALQQHIDNLKSEGQLWRVNMERKDAQLQGLREELDELVKERALLQAGIQAKQFQIDRMQADMAVLISPASDSTAIPALEIEELVILDFKLFLCFQSM
jgi:chromosome segregation ATPase